MASSQYDLQLTSEGFIRPPSNQTSTLIESSEHVQIKLVSVSLVWTEGCEISTAEESGSDLV